MVIEFAFSRHMEIILVITTLITNTLSMYLIASLLMRFSDEKATQKQKMFFALFTGALTHTAFIYIVYLFGGAVSLSSVVYLLVVSPNPLFALLYYLLGTKFLKLPHVRSARLMGYAYLYVIIIQNINRLIGTMFFAQQSPTASYPHYNYMLDALQQIAAFAVILAAYRLTLYLIKKRKISLRISDKVFVNQKRDLLVYFAKVSFIYSITVIFPIFIGNLGVAYFFAVLLLGTFLYANLSHDNLVSARQEIENRDVHISVLSKGTNEFSALKHDFYNILQTYSGYLDVGDYEKLRKYHTTLINTTTYAGDVLDLSMRLQSNPPLVSLLIAKVELAKSVNVNIKISLLSSLDEMYIDSLDICRCVACLLDNAIEAADMSDEKKVTFTVEEKSDDSKLIIVANSTASNVDIHSITSKGTTSKPGHQGIGLYNVRSILDKHGNCTFQLAYYNHEFTAYIGLKKMV